MPTIRILKDHNRPYVLINKKLIRNSDVSPSCRMLVVFIDSFEDIKITFDYLFQHFDKNLTKDEVNRLIKEAIAAGYLEGSNE